MGLEIGMNKPQFLEVNNVVAITKSCKKITDQMTESTMEERDSRTSALYSAGPLGCYRPPIHHTMLLYQISRCRFNAALYPIKIDPSELNVSSQVLGCGAFASVYKGHLMTSSSPASGLRAVSDIYSDGRKPVAVKIIHDHLVDVHR